MAVGSHVTLDAVVTCAKWPDVEELRTLLETAAKAGGATPLESRVILLPCAKSREDSPPGGTAWCGLDESHITLHWYTGKDTVTFALDVFTCGKHSDAEKIVNFLETRLGADTPEWSHRSFIERLKRIEQS